jgi:PhnB protein
MGTRLVIKWALTARVIEFHNFALPRSPLTRAGTPVPANHRHGRSPCGPVKPIPENFHSITPNLVCRNAAQAIDFYKAVFGATEIVRMHGPDGKIMHAVLKIGDSRIFVNDTMGNSMPSSPGPGISNPIYLHVYVANVDAIFNRAVENGARVDMPVQDMFWGDRYGQFTDPFGQQWAVATHKEDVAPEDLKRRQDAFFAKAAGQH